MAVCYITQLEVYPSNPQNDLLDIKKVNDSVNLLEDLNYIRSVIRAMHGYSSTDTRRWNDIPVGNTITALVQKIQAIETRISNVTSTTNVGDLPTVDPPLPPSGNPLAAYSVHGMILTNKDPLVTDAFIPGEILYTYVFNKPSRVVNSTFGHVFAELPAAIVESSVITIPVSVDFSILDKNNNVVGKFSFTGGNNTAQVYKYPEIAVLDFKAGDHIKIIANSSTFSNLENLSFYLEFETQDYYTSGSTQKIDLYTYIPELKELVEKLDVTDAGSPPFTLLNHKNLNNFTINQYNPGRAITSKAPTTEVTLYLKKNNVQIGTIVFAANSKIGQIAMSAVSTEFIPQDELTITTGSPFTSTNLYLMNDLSLNLITNYTNQSTKLQNGIHAFIPGNIPDEITLFSYVSPLANKVNFVESKFVLNTTPTKVINLFVYKNNTQIGYVTFLPGKNIGQTSVQDLTILNPGDCLYIKSGDNNPTGNTSTAQNLLMSLIFDKQL